MPVGTAFLPSLQLNVSFKHFVPILCEMKIVATIEKIEGKKVFVQGRILCPETGKVLATSEGLFYRSASPDSMLTYEQGRRMFGANSKYSAEQVLSLIHI